MLIKEEPPESLTTAGLILPDTAKEPTLKGVVISRGPGMYTEQGALIPPCVEVGDLVLIQAFAGSRISIEDQEYIIVNDRDILCIVETGARVVNNAKVLNAIG